jgi:thioredoxin-like negative regulator of GroEL
MGKTRREMIEEMLAAEPHDAFLRYGLALEFAREGQPDAAIEHLQSLIADQADYVPAYFQAAQLLLTRGDTSSAAELLRAGIEVARKQSNLHAAEEMSALLAGIGSGE